MRVRAERDARAREEGIKLLPVEILRWIFTLTLGSPPPLLDDRPVCDIVHGPLRISHVNAHWRHTALATPKLWSTIYITSGTSINLLRFLFEHSKAYSLWIGFRCGSDSRSPKISPEVYSLLQIHAERVEAISFAGDELETIEAITANMSALKEIGLHSSLGLQRISDKVPFVFPTTPSSNISNFRATFSVILPPLFVGRNLCVLEITAITLQYMPLKLMASCPNLEVARFRIPRDIRLPSSAIYDNQVRAARLTDLSLSFPDQQDWNVLRSVMTNLYAPQLQTVTLQINSWPPTEDTRDWDVSAHGTFGLASATRIVVVHPGSSDRAIMLYTKMFHALASFENVEHLELNRMRLGCLLDNRALCSPEHRQIFPKLRTLLFRDGYLTAEDKRGNFFTNLDRWGEERFGTVVVEEPYHETLRGSTESFMESSECSLVWRESSERGWRIALGEDVQSCDQQLSGW